jgi:tyrosyl-tRNA synthetase
MLSIEEQMHIIKSGAANIVPEEDLLEKLKTGRSLRIKLGVDPTAPDIHIGHAVPLRKLRQFQDLGHTVVLIIGNGTGLIGDPSGRNSTRPQLTQDEVAKNAKTYVDQAFKILDPDKTELCYNADWLLELDMKKLLELMSKFTVARILERDDFHNRYTNNQPISLHEFLYPVMQAYDSVAIKADVELGGTDQLFNLLAGRELMEKMGLEPQVALTMPLLEGTDGVRKMSKSYGNYIGLTDAPEDIFGKCMSIPDEMIVKYARLASSFSVEKCDEIEEGLSSGSIDPYKCKREIASDLVRSYYDDEQAKVAEHHFDIVCKQGDVPDDIPIFDGELVLNDEGKVYLAALLQEVGFASSASEARRSIDSGAIKIDGEQLPQKSYNIERTQLEGHVLKCGKRKFMQF